MSSTSPPLTTVGNLFLLNNQLDALIIQIYSVIKLYMFRASSLPIIRNFSTVHSALVSFMQVSDDRFQAESGWNDSLKNIVWRGAKLLECPGAHICRTGPWLKLFVAHVWARFTWLSIGSFCEQVNRWRIFSLHKTGTKRVSAHCYRKILCRGVW
jgi:hypothetical protein